MDICRNLLSSTGISLGEIEIATDYLYNDPEIYEPELSEVKKETYNKESNYSYKIKQTEKIIDCDITKKFEISIDEYSKKEDKKDGTLNSDIWNTECDNKEIRLKAERKEIEQTEENLDEQEETIEEYEQEENLDGQEETIEEYEQEETIEEIEDKILGGIIEENRHKCEEEAGIIEIIKDITNKEEKINKENKRYTEKINKKETQKRNITIEQYDEMSLDILNKHMRAYLMENNVSKQPVDVQKVVNQFGYNNVNRLLNKCYIIKIGKGVTTGI